MKGPLNGALTFPRRIRDDIRHLCLRRVLTQCPQQVTQHFSLHLPRPLLVEQREGFFVLGVITLDLSIDQGEWWW